MELLSSKLLEQIAYKTRSKIEEHMLINMGKSHEEHLYQPLQTNNKQFKIAVTFLSAYIGIFNIEYIKNNFYFEKYFDDGEFIQIAIAPGAYKIESVNDEIRRIIIDKGYYSESNYPFKIKPNFSTLGSIIEINQTGPVISLSIIVQVVF